MSYATITVHGAAMVLSWLPLSRAGPSFALASADFTNTKRAGQLLDWVGPNLKVSYRRRSKASSTSPLKAL